MTMPTTSNKSITVYINELNEQLKAAKEDLIEKMQKFNAYNEAYRLLNDKIAFLEQSKRQLSATNELAKAVINLLDQKSSLVERMACNANLTKDAIKILVVSTEGIAQEAKQLKFLVQKLLDAIENTGCEFDENGVIIKAIDNLKTKIDEAMVKSLECISTVLETLQRAIIVEYFLGDSGATKGLTKAVQDLLAIIDVNTGDRTIHKFPREECPKDCYEYLEETLEASITDRIRKAEARSEAEKAKDLSATKVAAIEDSIAAAEKAGAC